MYTKKEVGLCVHCFQCAFSLAPAVMVPVTPVPSAPLLLQRMFTVCNELATVVVYAVWSNVLRGL
jgi:hypothetical protein